MSTTIADLAADSPLTYDQLAAAKRAGTLAATLAALTSAQRVAAAAVVAERRGMSLSHVLAVFGRAMDAAVCAACGGDATGYDGPAPAVCQACYAERSGAPTGTAEDGALNALGEPMPASEAEALARQLVRELNELEAMGQVGAQLARYDAKSAQVRALGFDIGPAGDGTLCLYDWQAQRPINPQNAKLDWGKPQPAPTPPPPPRQRQVGGSEWAQ